MMYHAKNFSVPFAPQRAQNNEHASNIGAIDGSNINNPANPVGGGKQRLRWTSDLHNRFVDAIAQLGGPDSGYSVLCRVLVIVVRLDALPKLPSAQMLCTDGIKMKDLHSMCCILVVYYLNALHMSHMCIKLEA